MQESTKNKTGIYGRKVDGTRPKSRKSIRKELGKMFAKFS